jgi:tetratricopeptide (TPR) repeat protein
MKQTSKSRRNLYTLFAGAIAMALPSLALAQGQIDAGRSNDASNRVGSGGRNTSAVNPNFNSNYIVNNGNRIVTGNVTMGREFRDNVGYTDPTAFRGTTAGELSDNFAKNSAGVPLAHTAEAAPNTSTTFYGAAQTVQPPAGYQLNANHTGYTPPPPTTGLRGLQDQRIGVIDLNQPMAPVPMPGEMLTRGSLNPQQAASALGVLTGSSLYGVREWNPQDPADRAFLENLLNRQNGYNRNQLDPRDVQRMRNELVPDQVAPADGTKTNNSLRLDRTFDSPSDPGVSNKPLNDQMQPKPLSSTGVNTDQSQRFKLLGAAHRTSTQYAEMNKRLEQYTNDLQKNDAAYAKEFNAALKTKLDAEAKALALKNKGTGTDNNLAKPPVDPTIATDPTKPKVKKPTPVRINTLAEGVRGEGLGNVLKKAEGLMKEGKFASALDQYDNAESVSANNPLIWLGRANAELGAGFFLRAEAHLKQAMTTDRALLMGQYDLTGMLGEDRLNKLVTDLKETASKDNKPTSVFLLAYIAYNTGHERQALGYLDLAEKRAGDQAGFYKMLKEHWALPDDGAKPDAPKTDAPKPEVTKPEVVKPDTATPAKPELNK